MGTVQSSHEWHPPPQPNAKLSSGPPVDYHMVAAEVALKQDSECSCFPKVHVTMKSDQLYTLLGEQFTKGYRLLYFMRRPGDLRLEFSGTVRAFFIGLFRRNHNLGGHVEEPESRQLRVVRSWVQSNIEDSGSFMSPKQRRIVHTTQLVENIAQNTQQGERLLAATETGQSEPQSSREFYSGLSPHNAMDLFFEVPHPVPRERYVYNIALVPAHVEYQIRGNIQFPEIQCNWKEMLQLHLQQGWRLIDIYIDTPMIEQTRVPAKQRAYFCRPTDTNGVWIFERPASMADNPRPLYEGTIMEQTVKVKNSSLGVKSAPDWLGVIQDMGARGWELSCVVECHKVEEGSIFSSSINIKSLLFFQRPLPD